jgi:hypothetical protein
MEITSLDEFNSKRAQIILERSYFVGNDGIQRSGTRIGTDITPENFFAHFILQVLTMDTIVVDVSQQSGRYPIQFSYLTKIRKTIARLATGQTIEPPQTIETIDDFFDFIYSEIEDRFDATEWSLIRNQIQLLIEEREQDKFFIHADRTLQG